MQTESINHQQPAVQWFDGFTKAVLLVMFVLLTFVFISAKYMADHKMEAGGTDDTVNSMASAASGTKAHAFVDLPGDAQVGAFSIANLCVGLIVGHLWSRLFGKDAARENMPEPGTETRTEPCARKEPEEPNDV